MLKIGDTFLLPETSSGTEHLYIVITEPDAYGKAVCVNVTTAYSFSERTCVLQTGDHPFIKHESVVRYQYAKILDLKLVDKGLNMAQSSFISKQHRSCSKELLERVQNGLLKSRMVPHNVRDYCIKIWGKP